MDEFFAKLYSLGFDGTGYKYAANDIIGGYTFIYRMNNVWTELQFERGKLFVNRTFNSNEAQEHIKHFLAQNELLYFSGRGQRFI